MCKSGGTPYIFWNRYKASFIRFYDSAVIKAEAFSSLENQSDKNFRAHVHKKSYEKIINFCINGIKSK